MTDTPNEQAPATRSEWLALIREAVRAEMIEREISALKFVDSLFPPQPPSEG